MPDAPFSNIDPWARSPRDETTKARSGDDEVRCLNTELQRLQRNLLSARASENRAD